MTFSGSAATCARVYDQTESDSAPREPENELTTSRGTLKNVILLLSLAANVILGAVASHYWLRSRATQLGLSSNSDALRSVAGAALLPSVRIEFRLAEEQPAAGLTPVQHKPGSPSTVYVRPEIIVSNADIESAKPTKDDFGSPAVRLMLSEDGRKKLNAAAMANPMKRIAILVGGKAILAPVMEDR